ncbi:MAG: hypothetical protein ACLRZH_02060 [Ruthenibacterium lactatiformans]
MSDDVAIACPPRSYSWTKTTVPSCPMPVDVTAEHEGYDPVHVAGVQVFDGEVSLLELLMIPVEEDETAAYTVAVSLRISISPRTSCSRAANPPAPPAVCLPPAHSGPAHHPRKDHGTPGPPSANVQNVTVSFRDYIKNVASSEVYPTWVGSTNPTIPGL